MDPMEVFYDEVRKAEDFVRNHLDGSGLPCSDHC